MSKMNFEARLERLNVPDLYGRIKAAYEDSITFESDFNLFHCSKMDERKQMGIPDAKNGLHLIRIRGYNYRYFQKRFYAIHLEGLRAIEVFTGYDPDRKYVERVKSLVESPAVFEYVLKDFRRALMAEDSWGYSVLVCALYGSYFRSSTPELFMKRYNDIVRAYYSMPKFIRKVDPSVLRSNDSDRSEFIRDALLQVKDVKKDKRYTIYWIIGAILEGYRVSCYSRADDVQSAMILSMLEKMAGMGDDEIADLYRYMRRVGFIVSKRPGLKSASVISRYIQDSNHLYESNPGINLKKIVKTMTLKEAVEASVYTHRNYQLYIMKERASYYIDETPTKCLVELSPELEELRFKTYGEMRQAALDLGHCIGGYVQSNDLFFRKGTVCAMVSVRDGRIIQCYDQHNTVTLASKSFSKWLVSRLENIKFLGEPDEGVTLNVVNFN